jgi:DNA-directed RNA polymerase specialized sigma24 family protein
VVSDQAVRDLEPLARRVAGSAHRSMPASADIEDVRQVAWIAGWRALQSFRSGSFDGFAVKRMQDRIIDWQRSERPGSRSDAPLEFFGDDALDGIPAQPDALWGGDPAVQYERRRMIADSLASMPPSMRAAAERALTGASVGDARLLSAAIAHCTRGPKRPLRKESRWQSTVRGMAPGSSVVLAKRDAKDVEGVLYWARIPHMKRTLPNGQVEIWREPSPEQRAARKSTPKGL